MIKVSILYPHCEGCRFDYHYYQETHIPFSQQQLGKALRAFTLERGLSGGPMGSAPHYVAIGHLLFDSLDAFYTNYGKHIEALMADIPNYTDIQPLIQISAV
jgi:uncharacterized protein (TIGR02118 family)